MKRRTMRAAAWWLALLLGLVSTSCSDSSDEGYRDDLVDAVRSDFPEDSPILEFTELDVDEFSACLADGLLHEVGADRLDELGVIEFGVYSDVIAQKVVLDVEGAAEFFTPFFDCVDWTPMVMDDLTTSGWPEPVAACVARKALDEPETRLAFIVGTRDPEGSGPPLGDDWRRIHERVIELQAGCDA